MKSEKYVIIDPCMILTNNRWKEFSSTFKNDALFKTKNDTEKQKEIFKKIRLDLVACKESANGIFNVVENDEEVEVDNVSGKYAVVSGKVVVVKASLGLLLKLKKMPKGAGVLVHVPESGRFFIDEEDSSVKVVDSSKEDKIVLYSLNK